MCIVLLVMLQEKLLCIINSTAAWNGNLSLTPLNQSLQILLIVMELNCWRCVYQNVLHGLPVYIVYHVVPSVHNNSRGRRVSNCDIYIGQTHYAQSALKVAICTYTVCTYKDKSCKKCCFISTTSFKRYQQVFCSCKSTNLICNLVQCVCMGYIVT